MRVSTTSALHHTQQQPAFMLCIRSDMMLHSIPVCGLLYACHRHAHPVAIALAHREILYSERRCDTPNERRDARALYAYSRDAVVCITTAHVMLRRICERARRLIMCSYSVPYRTVYVRRDEICARTRFCMCSTRFVHNEIFILSASD